MKNMKDIITKNSGPNLTKLLCVVLLLLFIYANGFLCASCNADEFSINNNGESVFFKDTSQKPDYVIALEKGDYKSGIKLIRPFAEKGDLFAQYTIGVLYSEGRGVSQNYYEAKKWWHLAAEKGEPHAQYNLGVLYFHGRGVSRNYHEAKKWWLLAAEGGEPRAQYNLGVIYLEGRGVPENHLEAKKWWLLAAENGEAQAQYKIGNLCVKENRNTRQGYKEAEKWWRKAAEQGHLEAQVSLATIYGTGNGVPQNYQVDIGGRPKNSKFPMIDH